MRSKPVRRLKRALPIVFVLVVLATGLFVARNLAGWLASPDPVRNAKVDIIAVPAEAGRTDMRVRRAVELLKRGRAKKVWVVPSSAGTVVREPDAIKAYADRQGRKNDVVVLAKPSRGLLRDARLIAVRLNRVERKERDDLSLAVVTSPLQAARTRLVFARETGDDVRVWSDGSRVRRRDLTGMAVETARLLSTVAALGPGPELRRGKVPVELPVRAIAGGLITALVAGAICRPLARRLGLVSLPRLWRVHTTPTPMLGGVALLAGLGGGVIAAGGVRLGAVGAAAAAGVIVVAIVGLIDDIAGLGVRVRLLWAAGAGAVAWLLGLRALVFSPGNSGGDVLNALVTILWFVGVTYALNNFDNVDGSLGGAAAISGATIAVVAVLDGQFVVAVAGAAVAGACLGYLVHNYHPARLFMGDMGALGLGFALAALGLALKPDLQPPVSLAVPVLALGIPIFDTVLVTLSRMGARRSPAVGGTDHSSHRLLARGLSVRQAVGFLWGAQIVLGVCAVLLSQSAQRVGWVVVAVVGAAGIVALVVFLRMPPWQVPWQLEASERVVHAVQRAMRALRGLEEAVGDEAWRLSDPRAARSTQETLRRLERIRVLLDAGAAAGPTGDPSAGTVEGS